MKKIKVVEMKKEKKEKPILYEAWLQKKYKSYSQEEETDYIKIFAEAVKNIFWFLIHLVVFGLAGIAVVVLINDSTRNALLQLLYNINLHF